VTIHRTGNYSVDYQLSALSEIAARTKTMSDEFIGEEANDVTEAFYAYARPLLEEACLNRTGFALRRSPNC